MALNLFDANFYRAANQDLARLDDTQLKSHFSSYGLNEGRRFNALVDLNYYRASNSDLTSLDNRQAYEHLSQYGISEGRKFSPFYNSDFYRSNNSDLRSLNNEQLFDHLSKYGVSEGRKFSPVVDLGFYRASNVNGDLAGLNNNQAFQHLVVYGLDEGRRFSPFVNLRLYEAANQDLSTISLDNKALFEHLTSYGINEGRRFSVSYDTNYYRNTNPDLQQAGLNNSQLLEHFQNNGLTEGRISSESFGVGYYLANNSDLRQLSFSNQQALQHFEVYGFNEGRPGAPSNSISPAPNRDDNTLSNAFNFGVLNGSRNFSGQFVGPNDPNDYYRFTLGQTRNLNLNLSTSNSRASFELIYDANGNGQYDIGERIGEFYGNTINVTLGAGSYYIRVYSNIVDSNYTLGISSNPATVTTPADPGNNLVRALDIGTVSTKRNFIDFVGVSDKNDYYRFNLTQASYLNLSLTELTGFASVELIYDANGDGQYDISERILDDGSNIGKFDSLSTALGAGSYFIRVHSDYTGTNANYNLGVSATAIQTLANDPGNNSATALNIGTLGVGGGTRTFRDFVGTTDNEDWYRFSLSSTRNFSLSLANLTNNAVVDLFFDANGDGVVDYSKGYLASDFFGGRNRNGSIVRTLSAGTYFVRVYGGPLIKYNAAYTLSLSA